LHRKQPYHKRLEQQSQPLSESSSDHRLPLVRIRLLRCKHLLLSPRRSIRWCQLEEWRHSE
ncbi:MAG: hypothetical protein M1823_006583, partial [Watsoniomyces obsoletus]